MRKKRLSMILVVLLSVLLASASSIFAVSASTVFEDDFETDLGNWTIIGDPAKVFLDTAQAYSGIKSLRVLGGSGIFGVYTNISMTSPATITAYMYDEGSNDASVVMQLNADMTDGTRQDFGIETLYSGTHYAWDKDVCGTTERIVTLVPRSVGWHKLEARVTDTSTELYIDDNYIGETVALTVSSFRSYGFACGWNFVGGAWFDRTAVVIISLGATIDFNPNTLNLKSKGRYVTAYIELPEGYNVADIDMASVQLLVGTTRIVGAELSPTEIGDHDGDGVADLMVKFDRSAVQGAVSLGQLS